MIGPGQPSVHLRGREEGTLVGGWAMLRTDGETPSGRFTGVLTMGYSAALGHFVGTWIDSTSDVLVELEGTLDPRSRTLTLESTRPDPARPDRRIRYRDTIELVTRGEKIVRSAMQIDCAWVTFLTSRYRR
jgi:hypothetical protein